MHRRRRADRRHGLGGAEQHRRRQGPPAGHRRQRQRALLRADHRRPGQPPGHAAHHRGYERVLARGKDGAAAHARRRRRRSTRRCTAPRRASRTSSRPQGMFEDLGLKYVGPIDGHDIEALESALRRAKRFGGPVIVHCLTEKGRGYPPAVERRGRPASTPSAAIDPDTGLPIAPRAPAGPACSATRWSARRGARRTSSPSPPRCCSPVGLTKFAEALPGPGLRRRHRRAARA